MIIQMNIKIKMMMNSIMIINKLKIDPINLIMLNNKTLNKTSIFM